MKSIRARIFCTVLLAAVPGVAGAAMLPLPFTKEAVPTHSLQGAQNEAQPEVKTFAGTITLSNGKYVLEDPSTKRSYYLDDAKAAQKYERKMVVVTGTLDNSGHTIHVQKIEAAV
jgi:uncharacterized protein DUF5818